MGTFGREVATQRPGANGRMQERRPTLRGGLRICGNSDRDISHASNVRLALLCVLPLECTTRCTDRGCTLWVEAQGGGHAATDVFVDGGTFSGLRLAWIGSWVSARCRCGSVGRPCSSPAILAAKAYGWGGRARKCPVGHWSSEPSAETSVCATSEASKCPNSRGRLKSATFASKTRYG
jgi:hypothetical protein